MYYQLVQQFNRYNFFLDDGSYHEAKYSGIVKADKTRKVTKYSHCLSFCSVNQSCAAVLYEHSTTTCYMSHQPHVFYNYDIDGQVAFVKNANYNKLQLYEFKTNLTFGK